MSKSLSQLKESAPILSVGLVQGPLGELQRARDEVEHAGVEYIHVDLTDGHYSPLELAGPAFLRATRGRAVLDIHLLVDRPEDFIPLVAAYEPGVVTIHPDSTPRPKEVLRRFGEEVGGNRAVTRGLCVLPGQGLEPIASLLDEVELLLLLTLDPRTGYRETVDETLRRIEGLRSALDGPGSPVVGVDGGVSVDSAGRFVEAGAEYLVAGSSVWRGNHHENVGALLREMGRGHHSPPG